MRVRGGSDYVDYIRRVLSTEPPSHKEFETYEFRLFDGLCEMQDQILRREGEVGLARLVAGFAWPWKSKKDRTAYDIEIDGCRLRWNQTAQDWINSPGSINEVGSIHTVQGYDLKYAGVIIGPELRYDPQTRQLTIDRARYFDTKGKENNPRLGITYTDDDLLQYIANIYGVLLTRECWERTFTYAIQAFGSTFASLLSRATAGPSRYLSIPLPLRPTVTNGAAPACEGDPPWMTNRKANHASPKGWRRSSRECSTTCGVEDERVLFWVRTCSTARRP